MIKKIFCLTLFIKIAVLVLIFLAFNLLPFNSKTYFANFSYPTGEKISLGSAFKTWDAQHYLFLSQQGYKPNIESDRFFPLLPAGIALVNILVRNPVLSGLIVANVFSFLGIFYFFLFCRLFLKNEEQAFKSILFLLAFPTAFFLSLIYSESILLFLTSAFFYYLYSKKYFLASLFVFFIPIARPVGILIALPYGIYWLNEIWQRSKNNWLAFLVKFFKTKATYYLLSPILGFAVYAIFMQLVTGSFMEGFRQQGLVVSGWSITNVFDPIYFLVNLFSPGSFAIHGFTNSIIDRIFFISYCISLILIYKRLDKTMFVYALVFGMTPLFGSFMSYTRYVLMVLPIFIVTAKILTEKKYDLFFYPILFFMIMLQTLFIIMHALNYWVA
jgi:hypothetical protein